MVIIPGGHRQLCESSATAPSLMAGARRQLRESVGVLGMPEPSNLVVQETSDRDGFREMKKETRAM
jgi:hypothetical protein